MDINNFEYAVMQKTVGRLKTIKTLILVSYALFTVIYFSFVFISKLLPLGAVYPFLIYILVLATYRYVQIDNKYSIISGNLIFTRKYGNSKPKAICEFRLKNAELVAPLAQSDAEISSFAPKNIYDARSATDIDGAYVALFKDEDGTPCAFYFEVTEEARRVLKYYAKNYIGTAKE